MNRHQWERLQAIFHHAQTLPPEARADYVASECGDDDTLRVQVESMLGADEQWPGELVADALDQVGEAQAGLDYQTIGPYRLVRRIGVGGMGLVYLAERADGAFDRQVALKVVKKGMDTEEVVSRFQVERQILARLDHPNIAHLLDGGVTPDGRPYFVMEYVDGTPIDRYCDHQQLTVRERIQLFRTVCDAVHYAHQSLVIHRDLKPSNILVTAEGVAKLLDFGIAKVLDDSQQQHRTRTGRSLLTPAYASPEQLASEPVTTAADVYALGVVLYELLTSRRPFEEKLSDAELRRRVLEGDPAPPSTVITRLATNDDPTTTAENVGRARSTGPGRLRKRLRGDLDNICLKALRRKPGDRYLSADQVAADIDRHLQGLPVEARADSVRYRLAKFVRRHRVGVAATTAVFGAFAALVVFYTSQLARERDAARQEQAKTAEVVEFVTGLFRVSDPSESRGEEITARQLIDDGAARIKNELQDRPEVRAKMLSVLGEVNYNLGAHVASEEQLTEALRLQRDQYGDAHPDVATTQLVLGFLHQDRGETDVADALYREALATRRSLLDDTHPDVIEAISIRAFLEETDANYDEAERLHREALRLARAGASGDDALVAQAMTKLAGVLRILDKNEEAEALLRDALAMQERVYGGEHPELATTQRQLAGLLRNTRRFEEAKDLYETLIASRLRMLGPDHLEVAHSYNSYSQLLSDMGETAAAIDAQRKMIDIVARTQGDVHPSLGAAYNNLAIYLRDDGDLDGAIDYFDRALAVLDALELDPSHPNRSFPMGGKAGIYLRQDRHAEAEALLLEALVLRRNTWPEEHRLVQELKSSLGEALTGLGRFEEAETLLQEAHARFLEDRGPDDPRTITTARRLEDLRGRTEPTAVD